MQIQRTPHGFDCKAATTPDGPRAVSVPCIWNGNTAPAVLDAWHLSQMKKSPDFIRGVSYRNI